MHNGNTSTNCFEIRKKTFRGRVDNASEGGRQWHEATRQDSPNVGQKQAREPLY